MQGLDPTPGRVDMHDKRVPTEDQPPATRPGSGQCCYSYGDVGIGPFRDKMLAQPEDFWSEDTQAKENVKIDRPFHDNLGVGKVIFIFSDTAAAPQALYLPRWNEWKELLLPIFTAMKLTERQVVRCLLARMPPGARIPPHHDNGKWVSHTHRVHVAVTTNPDVHFTAGPTFETMERYAFNPGIAVELNNAAKHSVENRSDQTRVHLILDWVEAEVVPRLPAAVTLQPGMRVRQIRGRNEVLEGAEQPQEQIAARGEYTRRCSLAGELALELGGEEMQERLTVGRPALFRKVDIYTLACHSANLCTAHWFAVDLIGCAPGVVQWYIQHLDTAEFWAAVLASLPPPVDDDDDAKEATDRRAGLVAQLGESCAFAAEAADPQMVRNCLTLCCGTPCGYILRGGRCCFCARGSSSGLY